MNRFMKKLFVFICVFAIGMGVFLWSTSLPGYGYWWANILNAKEYAIINSASTITYNIDKVREDVLYESLIVGDSVCAQIYNEFQDKNSEYLIIGSNRAITIAGQYAIIKEFLNCHPEAKEVNLIVIIDSFATEYDTTFGYQYGVVPFVITGLADYFEEETIGEIKDIYGPLAISDAFINIIAYSDVNSKIFLNMLNEKDAETTGEINVSQVTMTYLGKIAQLCEEKGVTFHLIPSPLMDTQERHLEAQKIEEELIESGYAEMCNLYFDNIIYYPEHYFADSVHFNEEYGTQEFYIEYIEKLASETGLLQDFNY